MRTVYIDSEFQCHVTGDGTMTAVETAFFDGKCDALIEGYRFVPAGESWTRADGEVFRGEMITPRTDAAQLEEAQAAYERQCLAEYAALIDALYEEVQ